MAEISSTSNYSKLSVTLQVTSKQVEILMAGLAMGQVSLALRDIGSGQATSTTGDGTYTTDVEVSPFLTTINAERMEALGIMDALRAEEQEAEAAKSEAAKAEALKAEAVQAETQKAETKQVSPAAAVKPAPTKDVIKIYRGGIAETQEITIE